MSGLRLTLIGMFALIVLLTAALAYVGFGARGDDGAVGGESPAVAASAIPTAAVEVEPASAVQPTAVPAVALSESPPAIPATAAPAAAPPTAIQSPATPQAQAPAVSAAVRNPSADDAIPATEIVKILTPSVARVTTEFAGVAALNSPLPPSGVGTGIVLDADGYILTNSHVIEGAETVSATLHDGSSHEASVVGLDPATDLAVIKIAAGGLSPAALGESANLLAGEDVIAIGHLMGMSGAPSVSKGVVSATGRHISSDSNFTIVDLIQTDASINLGNSGGPLVDSRAKVVGVNTAIVRGAQGVGFAINIDDAKVVAEQLIANGFVRRGYIGVLPSTLTPLAAAQLDLDADLEGVLLQRVLPDTPASTAGLRRLDIILAMDGHALTNTGELSKFLITRAPGESVEADILRDGAEMTLEITLGTRPDN